MLRLSPQQMDVLAGVARERFVRRTAAFFSVLWPAMLDRLGERYPAFIDLAVQHAQRHGLAEGPCVGRYVNLWFVWGPAFEDKPGFEWAREILLDARRSEFIKPHQLVRRTVDELTRLAAAPANRPGTGLSPDDFKAADERVAQGLADLGRLGEVVPSTMHVPRMSCDLDAIDLGLIDTAWRHEYRPVQGDWQRLPGPPAPDRVRIDAQQPVAPPSLTVLTHASGEGPPARLQVKTRAAAVCHPDTHPRVAFAGLHGLWEWRGHEATAVSWPVEAPPALPLPDASLHTGIAQEGAPRLHTLDVTTCGLRDHGAPLGDASLKVLSYPADQWLLAFRHPVRPAMAWPEPAAHADAGSPASLRLERDGQVLDHRAWQAGLRQLHDAFQAGMDRLLLAWERGSGVTHARLETGPSSLLSGQAGLTWGWREGPRGLVDPPVMRVEGSLDLIACALDLQLSGELSVAGAKARLRLHAHGQTPLRASITRDAAEPPLMDTLAPAVVRFHYPFTLDMDPLATPDLASVSPASVATGALSGEAGLRIKPGSGGLQWYFVLKVEPTATTLHVQDPVLGHSRQPRPLLPAMTLVDWSLG